MAVKFVPDEIVLIIHQDQLHRYGGSPGIRDVGLLESALAQPKATAGGKFVHRTVFDKAAAYAFHICSDHPFIDGNKRAAFMIMALFLVQNGWELTADEEEAYQIMMAVADEKLKKPAISSWLKTNSRRSRK